MEVFLSRSARFEPMIRARFQQEGLPGDLGYLALIESGYSSEAVSRSYAVGMWQFMRATGKGYGLRVDSWVDERRDPVKATDAAARHLRDLRERFGSLYLAAAAYNAGAGKVSRSLGKLEWDTPAADTVAEAADTTEPDQLADAAEAAADTLAGDRGRHARGGHGRYAGGRRGAAQDEPVRRAGQSPTSPATRPSSAWRRTTSWPPRPRTTCRS